MTHDNDIWIKHIVRLSRFSTTGGTYDGDGLSSNEWTHKSDLLSLEDLFLIISLNFKKEYESRPAVKIQYNFYSHSGDLVAQVCAYGDSVEVAHDKVVERLFYLRKAFNTDNNILKYLLEGI